MATHVFHRAAFAAFLAVPACVASAGVVPPNQPVAGQSQQDWTATWWQTMIAIPSAQNPITDPDGSFAGGGDLGEVFLLAGTFGGPVSRTITVRDDQHLFFPLFNFLYFADDVYGEVELRQFADEDLSFIRDLFADLDGASLVPNPLSTRIDSPPGLFDTVVPLDNIFGTPPGTYPSVAAGFWVMLEPLSMGTHSLRFGGATVGSPYYPDVAISADYTINVVPAPGITGFVAASVLAFGGRRRRAMNA